MSSHATVKNGGKYKLESYNPLNECKMQRNEKLNNYMRLNNKKCQECCVTNYQMSQIGQKDWRYGHRAYHIASAWTIKAGTNRTFPKS